MQAEYVALFVFTEGIVMSNSPLSGTFLKGTIIYASQNGKFYGNH